MKLKIKIAILISMLCTIFLVITSCNDIFNSLQDTEMAKSGNGSILVIINSNSNRTIIPQTALFTRYELEFSQGSVLILNETLFAISETIEIPYGEYSLAVIGFVGDNEVAKKTISLNIPADKIINITLEPVDGSGSFVWDFSQIENISIDSIKLFIDDMENAIVLKGTVIAGEVDNTSINNMILPAGCYVLVFDLTKNGVNKKWIEVLYVYTGLTSTYTPEWDASLFTEYNEESLELEAILFALNASSFSQVFFSHSEIFGVEADNFNEVKNTFVEFLLSQAPDTLADVKIIVDAALVTIGIADSYTSQSDAQAAVEELIKNGSNISYELYDTILKITIGNKIIINVIIDNSITPSEGLEFILINDGTAYDVSRGSATDTIIVIPAEHNGLPVTTIANNGFFGFTEMTSIILPESITSVGYNAFRYCNITSITIPANVTTLGYWAFMGCTNLSMVIVLGETPPSQEDSFYGTHPTLQIAVPADSVDVYKSVWDVLADRIIAIGGCAYLGEHDSSEWYVTQAATCTNEGSQELRCTRCDYIFDTDTITSLGHSFDNWTLTSSSIFSLTEVGMQATCSICNHHETKTVTLSEYLVTQESTTTNPVQLTFTSAVSLGDMEAGSGWTLLMEAIAEVDKFVNLDLSNVTMIGTTFITGNTGSLPLPAGLNKIISIFLPDNTVRIDDLAFWNCSDLKSVIIPIGVTNIGSFAFDRCSNLSYVIIPSTVTVINMYAFRDCTSITSITIPNVTSIGYDTFLNCNSLTSLTLGTITNVSNPDAFPGNLYEVYFAAGGGWGTYTRELGSVNWVRHGNPNENFSINFAQLQDLAPDITGPSIRLIGSVSDTTKPVTVNDPEQYSSITYFFNGNPITGDAISGELEETLIVSPSLFNNQTGSFYITVEVAKNGRRYSKIIIVTVRL